VLAVLEPYWAEIHADFDAHNQRFLQLAGANHDLIGRVLKMHLVIKNFLNSFLSAHYGISDLADETDVLPEGKTPPGWSIKHSLCEARHSST